MAADEVQRIVAWDANKYLRRLDPEDVKYSRGFLRCHPERWFPGIAASWVPLFHSLGIDVRVAEVRPLRRGPGELEFQFYGRVGDEGLGVGFDNQSASVLGEAIVPGAVNGIRGVVVEYIARRLLNSLANGWSGSLLGPIQFDALRSQPFSQAVGVVKVSLVISGAQIAIWLYLGSGLADELDGLWRRQLSSTARGSEFRGFSSSTGNIESSSIEVQIELAQLAVPPSVIGDYVRSGTVVDLEVLISDNVNLKIATKPWLPAQLRTVDRLFGLEIVAGSITPHTIASGMTRISVELPPFKLQSETLAEFSQVGALMITPHAVGNSARLVIHGEEVAKCQLGVYEGRFAVTVL